MAADNITNAAHQLRAAMEGWGTDEAKLIRVVAHTKPSDLVALHQAYSKLYQRDLIADIKKETSGDFEDALVACLTPPLVYDAQILRTAMKGIGTNETMLTEVISTRSPKELKDIAFEFKRQFEHNLEEDVRSETRGNLEKFYCSRLKCVEEKGDLNRDVELLYKAGQGKIGTDDAVFISILSARSPEYIDQLNVAYSNKHGKSLAKVIDSEFSGDLREALLALVTPNHEYFAEKLYKAMKGAGTDEKTLIRIIASQRGRKLKEIALEYLKKHEVSLKQAVSNEVSGDFKKLLVAVLEFVVEGK